VPIKVRKQHFGDLPAKALEGPEIINRFKMESEYARKVEIATMQAILRAAIRWGQAQTPALIEKSPFRRFGLWLNQKAETVRESANLARRGEASPRRRLGDEHLAASLRPFAHARSDHRGVGAVVPAR
jgi:hypothetical protein